MEWFRLYHEYAGDPKFLAVADEAGTSVELAQSCYMQGLVYASRNEADRGSIAGLDLRVVAAYYRTAISRVEAIFAALRSFGMIVGDRIAKFAKRQCLERVSHPINAGALRQRAYSKKKKFDARSPQLDLGDTGPPKPPAIEPAVRGNGALSWDDLATLAARKVKRPKLPHPRQSEPPIESVTSASPGVISSVISATDLDSEEDKERKVLPSGARRARAPATPSVINFPGKQRNHGDGPTWLSEDWCPNERDCQYASAKGYDEAWISDQCERFNNYHGANGSKFLDWHKAWRTWVLRARDFSGGRGGYGIAGRSRTQSGPITDAVNAIRARRNLG